MHCSGLEDLSPRLVWTTGQKYVWTLQLVFSLTQRFVGGAGAGVWQEGSLAQVLACDQALDPWDPPNNQNL